MERFQRWKTLEKFLRFKRYSNSNKGIFKNRETDQNMRYLLRSLIKYKTREREKGENSNSGPKKSVLEGMGPPISSSNAGPKGMRRSTHQAA